MSPNVIRLVKTSNITFTRNLFKLLKRENTKQNGVLNQNNIVTIIQYYSL